MKSYTITDEMKHGPVEKLYDVMVNRMEEFASECGENLSTPDGGERPVVGFCFSFPVEQKALNDGALIHWTKGALLRVGARYNSLDGGHSRAQQICKFHFQGIF